MNTFFYLIPGRNFRQIEKKVELKIILATRYHYILIPLCFEKAVFVGDLKLEFD